MQDGGGRGLEELRGEQKCHSWSMERNQKDQKREEGFLENEGSRGGKPWECKENVFVRN